ncbi:MAG: hypothetical protein LBQ93_01500 [Treponema sp.]|jgi:hypothetical protein|nr:hypothetical protein [Treponema sp.]
MTDYDKIIEEARAARLPYESWERLPGETDMAFAAFCSFRDCGVDRSIKKAIESYEKNADKRVKSSKTWCNWCSQYRWRERAADFDRYIEKLKVTEMRKTIEAQGQKQREVTGKMLDVVSKKLDAMNPNDLSQGAVPEWVEIAVKAEREAAALVAGKDGKAEPKQGEFIFTTDFQGL